MPLFSVLLALQIYLQIRSPGHSIQTLSHQMQSFCQGLFQFSSPHLSFYKALACGVNIDAPSHEKYEVLKRVSLWHLVIVSAGHFQVLLYGLNRLPFKSKALEHTVLILFCLSTGTQPPVLRAYFDWAIKMASKQFQLFLPVSYRILFSGCLCLLLFPDWIRSPSLILSWMCALLIGLVQKFHPLIQAVILALFLLPLVTKFSTPHPLGFLFNFAFTPILSLLLFPLTLLLIPIPQIHFMVDPGMDALLFIISSLAGPPPEVPLIGEISPNLFQTWLYLFAVQILLIARRNKSKNAKP